MAVGWSHAARMPPRGSASDTGRLAALSWGLVCSVPAATGNGLCLSHHPEPPPGQSISQGPGPPWAQRPSPAAPWGHLQRLCPAPDPELLWAPLRTSCAPSPLCPPSAQPGSHHLHRCYALSTPQGPDHSEPRFQCLVPGRPTKGVWCCPHSTGREMETRRASVLSQRVCRADVARLEHSWS